MWMKADHATYGLILYPESLILYIMRHIAYYLIMYHDHALDHAIV